MGNEQQDSNDVYNEMLLKNAALSFSSEGIATDVSELLAGKAVFVSDMINSFAAIIGSSSGSRVSVERQKLFDDMIKYALSESKAVNSIFSRVLSEVLDVEDSIKKLKSNLEADDISDVPPKAQPKRQKKSS